MKLTNTTSSTQSRKLLSLAAVAAVGLTGQTFGQDALLIDFFNGSNPTGTSSWTTAGVSEDLTGAAIGTILSDGRVFNIDNLSTSNYAAGRFSETFFNNHIQDNYHFQRTDSGPSNITFSIGGFVDGTGAAQTMTTNNAFGTATSGKTFTLQANQDYTLYMIGAVNTGATFTFNGESKSTSDTIADPINISDHFVTFDFTTGSDLSGFTLDLDIANNSGSGIFYSWGGAALVAVPETSSFGLILGGFAIGLIAIRRRR